MSLTVSELVGLQTSKYFNVAGLAILVFDYTITFEDEVRWTWGRSWDPIRCIFMVARYLPFAGVGMTAYSALRTSTDPCSQSTVENVIHIVGIIAAEVLLVLRTYAFWQSDKRILYFFLPYSCVTIGAAVTINVFPQYLLPGDEPPPGCYLLSGRNATLVYLCLLLFEIVILSLTAYKRFHSYREIRAPIMLTVYRDGMFYMFCIILITFSNVLLDGIFPTQFSELLDIPQITLHSVLASRIMFNLRKSFHSQERERSMNSTTLDDFRCHPSPDSHQQSEHIGSESFGPRNERPIRPVSSGQ